MTAVEGGPDMAAAVGIAATLARPGDAVILSPAYSSLDQYTSFVQRGRAFQDAVSGLAPKAAGGSSPRAW